MISCADASFIFSIYLTDANSAAAETKILRAKLPILVTDLAELEFTNAVNLRVFRNQLQPSQAKNALTDFRSDVESRVLRVVPLPASIFQHARRISEQRTPVLGTRALDLLQVAAAIALKAELFYTFDVKQAKLAAAEGLRVP